MRQLWGILLCVTVCVSGCAHPLTMQNIDLYKAGFLNSSSANIKVGISATTSNPEEERLVVATANALKRDGVQVVYPFFTNETSLKQVDYVLKLSTSSQFKGSGVNFLINWPGFLIFAPALFGYSYTAAFNIDADVVDVKSGAAIPRINIPIEIKFKHADMNRTWTEISWFEFSVIAFIGGICFTQYDKSVTPQLMNSLEYKLGDYIESKLLAALVSAHGT